MHTQDETACPVKSDPNLHCQQNIIKLLLTLSQTSPGFYMYAVQGF